MISGFRYSGKVTMSLATAEAPAPDDVALIDEQEKREREQAASIERAKQFNARNTAAVEKDFRIARDHAKNNRYILAVTPERVAVRLQDEASVCVDLEGPGCENNILLRALYRAQCPSDIEVEFGYRTMFNATCGDHLEDIFLLEIRFHILPRPKKKRGSPKE